MVQEISNLTLEAICTKIATLTENNNHTEAIKVVCGLFGYESLFAICRGITYLHDKAGSISSELLSIRSTVKKELLKNIQRDYSDLVYQSIKNAY